jgi:hypothetical protein
MQHRPGMAECCIAHSNTVVLKPAISFNPDWVVRILSCIINMWCSQHSYVVNTLYVALYDPWFINKDWEDLQSLGWQWHWCLVHHCLLGSLEVQGGCAHPNNLLKKEGYKATPRVALVAQCKSILFLKKLSESLFLSSHFQNLSFYVSLWWFLLLSLLVSKYLSSK